MKLRGSKLRRDAMAILQAAIAAADAGNAVRKHLSLSSNSLRAGKLRVALKDFDRIFLVSVGKAALEMAIAVEKILGSRMTGGVAVTKYGHSDSRLHRFDIIEAGHPIPDDEGVRGSGMVRELLQQLNARDLLIAAISGGASALLPAPMETISLKAKQITTELLLRAGATIAEVNAIRKHLSNLKGGRMAALAYPATVVGLLLSDVIGDSLDVIGSGPTVPDMSTFSDCLAVLKKFGLMDHVPSAVREHLKRGSRGEISETPKPKDPIFENVHNLVIGSNRLALEAASRKAKSLGFRTLILSSTIQGEAREVAGVHVEILREVDSSGSPISRPACLLSGGETTVTVQGNGKGGRNQEFALAAALRMQGLPDALMLSAGTDGSDGPTDAAGAIATGETVARAMQAGIDVREHLTNNDSYTFFDSLGDLIRTGATGTNVMDIHLLLAG